MCIRDSDDPDAAAGRLGGSIRVVGKADRRLGRAVARALGGHRAGSQVGAARSTGWPARPRPRPRTRARPP
eukprot:167157-Alexandrium_andersonii.AAC.1